MISCVLPYTPVQEVAENWGGDTDIWNQTVVDRTFGEQSEGEESQQGTIGIRAKCVDGINDIGTVKRIEALNEMTDLYKKYQQELSWLGGNFNQAMKRANELAIGNSLSQKYYEDVIIPQAKHILMFLEKLKSEQTKIAKKLIKL